MGNLFRSEMQKMADSHRDIITTVRGKGLLNAIVINPTAENKTAWEFCVDLKKRGLLAKPTHDHIIRFAPPLVITEEQVHWALDKIAKTVESFVKSETLEIV